MSSFVCPICRDLLTDPQELEVGLPRDYYRVVVTFCGHLFHEHCLAQWILSQRSRRLQITCPTCFVGMLELDIVPLKSEPNVNERFVDYHVLRKENEKLVDELINLNNEKEVAFINIDATKEWVANSGENVAELKEEIRRLKQLVDSSQAKVLCEKDYMKYITEKAVNLQTILKDVENLVNAHAGPSGANTKEPEEPGITGEKVDRKKEESDCEEIVRKIKMLFESSELFKDTEQAVEAEGETAIIGDCTPGFSYQVALMSRDMTKDKEKMDPTIFRTDGKSVVIVYIHRGRVYSPGFELFQLQIATFLRMCGISHTCQTLSADYQANPAPIMKIENREIFEPDICCSIIREYSVQQGKPRFQFKSPYTKNSLRRINKILDKSILWGLLLWQWFYNEGDVSTKIFPVHHSQEFSAALKEKLRTAAEEKMKPYLNKATLLRQVSYDIGFLSKELGSQDYFSGPLPEETDASAFILLSQLLWNCGASPLTQEVYKYENLVIFVIRFMTQFWPEWEAGNDLPHLWH